MESGIALLVGTTLVIAGAAALAPRLRIAAPLLLVLAGIGVSLSPRTPEVVIDPHLILLGLLPPLLYASAASMPVMNFRREFPAISALSVTLVVLSSLAIGGTFCWLVPALPFGWGVALGAILSPTDAVATSIIKGRGVPSRVVVLLDGEGLLNDASALIMLRTAIVAASAGFSFWSTLTSFASSVLIALVAGMCAGHLSLFVRKRVHDEAVNTILSFTTPFVAAVPAEMLHGSGLVAAVVAGIVTSMRAPRVLPPGHRMSDAQNWATLELVLEGLVFLTMGLQLSTIVDQVARESVGLLQGLGIAALLLVVTLLVRAAYVGPLLWRLNARAARWQKKVEPRFQAMQRELDAGQMPVLRGPHAWAFGRGDGAIARLASWLRRNLADIDYLTRQPLGRPEAIVVIWAGMRGAVTVAAAQLLPSDTPHRPLLVFVAFAVATMSLLLQGGSIGLLVRWLFPAQNRGANETEAARVAALLDGVRASVEGGASDTEQRLGLLRAQREALLDARDEGVFDAAVLEQALLDVDVDQLVLELRQPTLTDS